MSNPAETAQEIVHLTERAQTKARKFLAERPDEVLRIGVTSGGCSGFSYDVTIGAQREGDTLQRYDGFTAAVDEAAIEFLGGATLDYVDTIGHAGWTFDNPRAKSSCGCGTSFDV